MSLHLKSSSSWWLVWLELFQSWFSKQKSKSNLRNYVSNDKLDFVEHVNCIFFSCWYFFNDNISSNDEDWTQDQTSVYTKMSGLKIQMTFYHDSLCIANSNLSYHLVNPSWSLPFFIYIRYHERVFCELGIKSHMRIPYSRE